LSDPDLFGSTGAEAFWKFMRRMSYEQLLFQLPAYGELARSIALLEETRTTRACRVLNGNWAHRLLGCTITDYVATAFLLFVGALRNSGTFSLSWLKQENFEEFLEKLPGATVEQVVANHFLTSVAEFRSLDPGRVPGQHPDLRRHNFNPLQAKPILGGLIKPLLIPSPGLLVRKVSPLGLFYSGIDKLGGEFAIELGYLFEEYVGKQLRLMNDATLLPSIAYGRENLESVDWIAIFDDVVWLVEAKSTRTTETIRTASDDAGVDFERTLGKAVKQINRSAKQISNQRPEFSAVPKDRPLLGVIVTLEPFYSANSRDTRRHLPSADVPYAICSASELENIVTCNTAPIGSTLLNHILDASKDGWPSESAFHCQHRRGNPILRLAWSKLPWKSREDDQLANAQPENLDTGRE